MTAALADKDLARLGDFFALRLGLDFPPARWPDLQRGMERAAAEFGHRDVAEFANWVLTGDLARDQIAALAVHLTVPETYFFRDRALFHVLETSLLPDLIEKRRASGGRLRIWCAGCCTGDEAYSLAIVLHRLIPDVSTRDATILATDINAHSLEKAREGRYGPWSFRDGPSPHGSPFFRPAGGNTYRVHPSLRALVEFRTLNLAEDMYPSPANNTSAVDLLFCRNVLMYFAPDAARAVLERLAAALSDDGWLVIAPSELLLARRDLFATTQIGSTIILSKRPAQPPPVTPPEAPQRGSAAVSRGHGGRVKASQAIAPRYRPAHAPNSEPELEHATSLYAQGLHTDARAHAKRVLAARPGDAEAMRLLARICADEGLLDEALAFCDRAIAADRSQPAAYFLRSMILQGQGRSTDAGAALRQTLYLEPGFVIAHFSLASLAQAEGDARRARTHWRNAARLLAGCGPDDIVPESGGITAARLSAIIESAAGRGGAP